MFYIVRSETHIQLSSVFRSWVNKSREHRKTEGIIIQIFDNGHTHTCMSIQTIGKNLILIYTNLSILIKLACVHYCLTNITAFLEI
jgi:hypothetical protein